VKELSPRAMADYLRSHRPLLFLYVKTLQRASASQLAAQAMALAVVLGDELRAVIDEAVQSVPASRVYFARPGAIPNVTGISLETVPRHVARKLTLAPRPALAFVNVKPVEAPAATPWAPLAVGDV